MSTIARLSLAQYDRMIEHGVFDEEKQRRIEFIRGEIREMNPTGSRHEEIVERLAYWSIGSLPEDKVRVRTEHSIGLPEEESAPQPDVAWVAAGDYWEGRPDASDVLLVIEVSESSLAYDTGEKAALYAAAGIADYWVVNVPDRSIEVRRDPGASGYRSLQTFTGDDEVRPLAAPEIALRPAMLWPS